MKIQLRTRLFLSFLAVAVLIIGATVSLLYREIQTQTHIFEDQVEQANQVARQELPQADATLRAQLETLLDAEAVRNLSQELNHNMYDEDGHAELHRRELIRLQTSARLDLLHVRWAPKNKKVRDVLATHHSGIPTLNQTLNRYATGSMTTYVISEQSVGAEGRLLPVLVVGAQRSDGLILLIGRALNQQFLSDIRKRVGGKIELSMSNGDNTIKASTLSNAQQAVEPTVLVNHTNEGESTPVWMLKSHSSREPLRQRIKSLIDTTWIVSGIAVVLALLFGLWISRRLTRPINELVSVTQQVANGDKDLVFPQPSGDEVGTLVHAFRSMVDELEANEVRLKSMEREKAWEEIAQELAHEIKNPLTPIQMSIETLRRSWQRKHDDFGKHFDESTATILEEVDRLKTMVTSFRDYARTPALKKTLCDVGDLIQRSATLLDDPQNTVHVETNIASELPSVTADPEQLTQVLHNLIQNAIQACERASSTGPVRVEARRMESGGIEIRVEDTGDGIPSDDLPRVFSPLYSRREGGTGLGLAISQRIVLAHGGRIGVSSSLGTGTRFVLRLPPQS